VHVQRSGSPVHVSPTPVQSVPGLHVPPQPSLGVLPHARVDGAVHVGAQHEPSRQRSPAGHDVPFGQAAQPGGSTGSSPHESVSAGAQPGQHTPAMHVDPAAHRVPVPQLRHTRPIASTASGMGMPQSTVLAVGQRGQHEPLKQSEPKGHAVPRPQSRQSLPSDVSTSGTSTPQATVLALGQLAQHVREPAPLVPGGLVHDVPEGQRDPKPVHVRHVGLGMAVPQSTAVAAAQFSQQMPVEPPVQLEPLVHPAVPKPVHVRHTAPLASRTSGMRMPHGTLDGDAQAPQHTRAVGPPPPGGSTHERPAGHTLPTPGQARQSRPRSSVAGGMGVPHATVPEVAHSEQQLPSMHVSPAGQRVPVPAHVRLPMQVSGTSTPQSTASAPRHTSVHSHRPSTHARPSAQVPGHRPPQPSESPHAASGAHDGMHSQRPVSGLHSSRGPGHVAGQKPPHPSGVPHVASAGQRGTHTQRFPMQRSGGVHGGSHAQVGMQVPF
jgi:hypothetical protein